MAFKQSSNFYRFTLGEFEVVTLSDGGRVIEDAHKIYGSDRDAAEVGDLLEANFLPRRQVYNTFTPTLVATGSERILFDTGMGEAGRVSGSGLLLASLKAAGYAPGDITLVVLTHLHGDHINGLTEAGRPAFPEARYMTGRTEYDYWTDTGLIGSRAEGGHKAVMEKLVPLKDKITFLSDGDAVAPGITGLDAPGHTPGHMVFRIESDGRKLMLTADTANHYVLSLQRPDWKVGFDTDTAKAAGTRKRIFDMVAAERMPFIGYHMPFPALGYVEKTGEGYRFMPETYQFNLG